MKNLKINIKRVKALAGAIILSTNLVACNSKNNDDKNVNLSDESIQYLYIDNKLVSLSDVRLTDKSKNIIDNIDGVLVNNEIRSVVNPVEIKLRNDIEGVIIEKKIYSPSDFDLINIYTNEVVDSIDGIFVNNELVSIDYDYEHNNADIKKEDNIIENVSEELLTNEKFEELCADRIKAFNDINLPVDKNDVIIYLMGTNSDKLAEDNYELIDDIIGEKSEIEIINDFGKVCAAIAMNNFKSFQNKSDNFIKVSDSIFGDQKDMMLKIETYINKIITEYSDSTKVNKYVSELFEELNSGELSKLDDGVGFSMSSYLMLLDAMDKSSYIVLNEDNRNMLAQLITSEKYVSNIKTVFTDCGNAKVRTK